MTSVVTEDLRTRFYRLLPELLAEDPRAVAVFGEVGVGYLDEAAVAPVADRVINVGIREQLVIGVAGGLALTGLRPIAHTFGPFLVERPFEQVKLDLGHQGVGAVLVSAGGSYDWPQGGETHFGYRDVAVLDTLDGWTVHVPGHPDEAEALLRAAVRDDGRVYLRLGADANAEAHPTGPMAVLRRGTPGHGRGRRADGRPHAGRHRGPRRHGALRHHRAAVRRRDAAGHARHPRRRARRALPARHVDRRRGPRARRPSAPGARPRRRAQRSCAPTAAGPTTTPATGSTSAASGPGSRNSCADRRAHLPRWPGEPLPHPPLDAHPAA